MHESRNVPAWADDVRFLKNTQYESTEMLLSFLQSSRQWDQSSDGLYMTYSDIVYTRSIAQAHLSL